MSRMDVFCQLGLMAVCVSLSKVLLLSLIVTSERGIETIVFNLIISPIIDGGQIHLNFVPFQ